MPVARFHFHAELNDFLPKRKQGLEISVSFESHETVKHLVEALGVPHTEVNVIIVDGMSVDFSAHLNDGNLVEVYPRLPVNNCSPIFQLQPYYMGPPRFVLDGHLGKLAVYLRLLGFDTLYRADYADDEISRISSGQNRILLTRDRGLLKRRQVRSGYYVRSLYPDEQIVEVLKRFNSVEWISLYSLCSLCNGKLVNVSKEEIIDRLEPKTQRYYDHFRICQECSQIYWRGSHYKRMESQLQKYVELADSIKR
jgi:uncharacterized protein with PIN domain